MARLMLRETGSGRTEGRTLHYLLALGQIYIDQCEKNAFLLVQNEQQAVNVCSYWNASDKPLTAHWGNVSSWKKYVP